MPAAKGSARTSLGPKSRYLLPRYSDFLKHGEHHELPLGIQHAVADCLQQDHQASGWICLPPSGRLSEWWTWRLSSRTTTLCSSSSPWTSRWTPPRFSFSMNILKSLLRTTVGVASDSSLAVKRWISKDVSCGGFGGPVGHLHLQFSFVC
jgi:hypothetical protein